MISFISVRIFVLINLLILFCSGCVRVQSIPSDIPSSPGIYHIVGSGQTLYRISKIYGVDIQDIIRINNIKNPDQIGIGEKLFIPGAKTLLPVEAYKPSRLSQIKKLVGRKHYKVKWRYITLHHSATSKGNAGIFDRYHRKRRMGGLAYHFVIGNGTDSQDGELEVGWRWTRQVQSCRKKDIQICLVGNFNRQRVSHTQFKSLVELIRILRKQYNIPLSNIRRHKDIKGRVTECPGRNFPFYNLLAELRKIGS